jgi:23S rRNA (pseudouridine1915-N3)-methyltransferase
MKVAFWCIGGTDETYLKEGITGYVKRLGNYLSIEYRELVIKGKKTATPEQHILSEKQEISRLLKPGDYLVLLDEDGNQYSSLSFADFLQKRFNSVQGNLVFLSGGPYGFHDDLYARANAKLSLSTMTFTHQMVRLIFLEQLYRAMTILRNEPYHHR